MKEKRVLDNSIELADNAMLKVKPKLFYQWDFKRNSKIGLDVYKVTKGQDVKAWWICKICTSPYDCSMANKVLGRGCPYCRGLKANHTNSLSSLRPDLAKEWHPTLNSGLTPDDVVCGHNEAVWWLGSECGHPWDASINSRTNMNSGCSYCAGQGVLMDFNDMWFTNPSLASQLANPEDGYKYTQSSGMKVDWKCLECKNIIKNKSIEKIYSRGLSCPRCSDGIQFPEKFMYNLLKESNIEFEFDIAQDWSQCKRYDFYLPEYNWIIETHGGQHYKVSFERMKKGARTLEEEIENDSLKKQLARKNGIDNYIIIDARESTVEWIKENILNSDIMKIIKEIDFIRIGQLASNSFVKEACNIWNSGIQSAPKIAVKMLLGRNTVTRYLKRGAEIGWCNYTVSRKRSIVQLSDDLNFIREWESNTDIGEQLGISGGNIISVCRGKRKTTGGFKWMYKEDYYKLMNMPLKTI